MNEQEGFEELVRQVGFSSTKQLCDFARKELDTLPVSYSQLRKIVGGQKPKRKAFETIQKITDLLNCKKDVTFTIQQVAEVLKIDLPFHSEGQDRNEEPPERFDKKYLLERLKARRGEDVKYLIIRYGSSVKEINPNDLDYMILIHGDASEPSQTIRYTGGKIDKSSDPLPSAFDIQEIEFDSFWAGIIRGNPFEMSAAIDGIIEDSIGMPRVYWEWLQTLAYNIRVSIPFLRESLRSELLIFNEDYGKTKERINDAPDEKEVGALYYNLIISAYHLACHLVKLKVLRQQPEEFVQAPVIYPLSKCNFLYEQIDSEDGKNLFAVLLKFFKRMEPAQNWFEFESEFFKLVEILNKEEQNVEST